MRTKKLILIGILMFVCIVGIFNYFYSNNTIEYQNITVNGVTLEVPKSNVTVVNQTEYYDIYNDNQYGVNVYVIDNLTTNNNSSDMQSFSSIITANQVGALKQNDTNYSYNYSDSLKQYTYLTNNATKHIFIITKNKKDMLHILSTMHVNPDSIKNETNTTETKKTTTATSTKKKTSKTKSSSASSHSKPKDTVNGGAKDIGGDYYQTADGKVHYGAKYYDHPGDSRYDHGYYT